MSRRKVIDREHVLNVAENLVTTFGPSALTIEAVAKAASISIGGVQSCFGTKDGLLGAMLKRWGDAYDQASITGVENAGDASPSLHAYLRVMASADSLNTKAASVLSAVLQAHAGLAWMRAWYAQRLEGVDVSTEDGRKARLAFFAAEGAFMLKYFGLMDVDGVTWRETFEDISRHLIQLPTRAASRDSCHR